MNESVFSQQNYPVAISKLKSIDIAVVVAVSIVELPGVVEVNILVK